MNFVKKGFTLIELLVVIGVLAVLMAGVVALINPRDKMLQAADSKVMSDISQLASGLQSIAAQDSDANYPATAAWPAIMTSSGELTVMPVPPTQAAGYGTAYTYVADNTTDPPTAVVSGRVMSAKYVTVACASVNAWWYWNSENGRACGVCQAAAPGVATTTCTF